MSKIYTAPPMKTLFDSYFKKVGELLYNEEGKEKKEKDETWRIIEILEGLRPLERKVRSFRLPRDSTLLS